MIGSTVRSASSPSLCGAIFDSANKRLELESTEDVISAADFWNSPENSQRVMQERKRLEKAISEDSEVLGMTDEIDTLFELGREGETVVPDLRAAEFVPDGDRGGV